MHAEDHHLRPPIVRSDLLRSLDPVELRHSYIQDRDIRVVLGNQFDRFSSIARLRDDVEIRLLFEQEPQPGPYDGVIVREENSNLSHV